MSKPVVWVDLPTRQPRGHEQQGRRPCILIQDLATMQALRYPMLLVVPMTTSYSGNPPLYVSLPPGTAGLKQGSTALLDQLLSVDSSRVVGYIGTLTEAEYQPVREALRRMLEA